MKRESGVLMHVSSLFGNYSSGSFGEEARYFIDFLCEAGFSVRQRATGATELQRSSWIPSTAPSC